LRTNIFNGNNPTPVFVCPYTGLHTATFLKKMSVPSPFLYRAAYSDSVAWNPVFPVLAFADERDDNRERMGVVSIWAPPKA
jgi:hypothetical protein